MDSNKYSNQKKNKSQKDTSQSGTQKPNTNPMDRTNQSDSQRESKKNS